MLKSLLLLSLLSLNGFATSVDNLWFELFEAPLVLNFNSREIASQVVNSYRPKIIAHRGVLTPDRIENTKNNILEAIQNRNVDGIEIDVCITKDDEIILWHDNNPFDMLGYVRRFGIEGRKIIPAILNKDIIQNKSVHQLTYSEVKESLGYINPQYDKSALFYEYQKIDIDIPRLQDLISEPFFQMAYPSDNGKTIFLDTKLPNDLTYTKKFALSLVKILKSVANAKSIQKNLVILQENPAKLKVIKDILIKNNLEVSYSVDHEITTSDRDTIVGVFSARDNCSMGNDYTSLGKPIPLFGPNAYNLFLQLNLRDRNFINNKCPQMKSVIWTINSFNDFEDVLAAKPDFVMTDHPGAFAIYFDKCYKKPNSICKK